MADQGSFNPDILSKPFGKELYKVNRFKSYKPRYVEAGHYIKALNEATGHRWNVEILEEKTVCKINKNGEDRKQPFFVVKIRLTIPEVGIAKEVYGGSCFVGDDPEDTMKAAQTDAIKKACWMLGIGVDVSIDPPEHPPERRLEDMPTQEQWSEMYRLSGYLPEPVDDPDVAREHKVQFMKDINELSTKRFGLGWQKITRSQADKLIKILKDDQDGQAG